MIKVHIHLDSKSNDVNARANEDNNSTKFVFVFPMFYLVLIYATEQFLLADQLCENYKQIKTCDRN